jgi:gamma-glutamylcyclotransferase (GGCT)/AIG2-like uncharacterized protein YtfP
MANSIVISSGLTRLYVNGKIYTSTQSVSMQNQTGEYEIFGINSPYPQEIAGGGQRTVHGEVSGVRTKNSGGLQGVNAIPLFSDVAASNYVALRLEDRSTGETLWSIPKAKLSNIQESISIKGVYKLSFSFMGQILFYPLDLS